MSVSVIDDIAYASYIPISNNQYAMGNEKFEYVVPVAYCQLAIAYCIIGIDFVLLTVENCEV